MRYVIRECVRNGIISQNVNFSRIGNFNFVISYDNQ